MEVVDLCRTAILVVEPTESVSTAPVTNSDPVTSTSNIGLIEYLSLDGGNQQYTVRNFEFANEYNKPRPFLYKCQEPGR